MKKLLLSAAVVFGSLVGMGCNKSEPGGAVGTENSFTVSAPTMSTSLKPKESKAVKLEVNRKDAFKEAVTFMVTDVPKGLKVDEKSKTADAATKEVTFTVTAEENAQPGDYIVKFSGKPEKTGKETLSEVKVKVEKP